MEIGFVTLNHFSIGAGFFVSYIFPSVTIFVVFRMVDLHPVRMLRLHQAAYRYTKEVGEIVQYSSGERRTTARSLEVFVTASVHAFVRGHPQTQNLEEYGILFRLEFFKA